MSKAGANRFGGILHLTTPSKLSRLSHRQLWRDSQRPDAASLFQVRRPLDFESRHHLEVLRWIAALELDHLIRVHVGGPLDLIETQGVPNWNDQTGGICPGPDCMDYCRIGTMVNGVPCTEPW